MEKYPKKAEKSGLGMALSLGSEMVSATLIGVGMGYGLDRWLETKPWLTILFLFFGIAAGFRNMYRAAVNSDSSNSNFSGN
ncbi:MAG: AtpZ/AtpI family protein [Magnetococcales bacterium]|nr:AtpZ/AtpI family protein [Magnetococcales bacterium]